MTDRGVLDTSVFIAGESGRRLDEDRLPDESAVSVVTLAELQAGVLAARDTATRAVRMGPLMPWVTWRYSPSTSTLRGSGHSFGCNSPRQDDASTSMTCGSLRLLPAADFQS